MTGPGTIPASACCRKCYYSLAGATAGRCPECGREFDPANAKPYLQRAPSRWRWVRRGVLALAMVAVLGAMRSPPPGTVTLAGMSAAPCDSSIVLVVKGWGEVPTSSQGSASGGYGLVACMTDPREPPASITQMLVGA